MLLKFYFELHSYFKSKGGFLGIKYVLCKYETCIKILKLPLAYQFVLVNLHTHADSFSLVI
jgi:hypothetical protein